MDDMGGDLRHSVRDDAGMTLIELVIAAAILLIAIVGLFGTLITATTMSVQAKQQNIAVNAANSYIEWARGLPFDSVGLRFAASPDPTGTLEPTSTIISGFTVVINPHVTWVHDPPLTGTQRYKQLEVNVVVSATSSRSYSQRFLTYVRRPDALQGGSGGGGAVPSISFTSGSKFLFTPPIYVSGYSDLVSAYAEIASGSSATLSNIEFRCDGTLLYGSVLGGSGSDGENAAWVNSGGTSGTFSFTWNTGAVDASGTVLFPDGQRVLRILVWDTAGGYRYRDSPVIIDNSPPTRIASPPWLVSRDSASGSTISWGPSWDGPTEFANHYVVHVFRETGGYVDLAGTYPPDLGDTEYDHAPTLGSNPTTNSFSVPTGPLKRYWVKVEAHSYPVTITHRTLGLTLGQGGTNMVTPFITRPSLAVAGTPSVSVSGKKWTMTTNVAWQAPGFSYDTVSYRLERSTDPLFTTPTPTLIQAYPNAATLAQSDLHEVTVSGSGVPAPYYYRLACTVHPTGQYNNGSTYTVYSNLVKLTPTVTGNGSNATYSLPYDQSDWSRNVAP